MLILCIETSTPVERVAVVRDGRVAAESTEVVGRGHTERLLGAVEAALDGSGVALADLDAIGVSIGPGRFSGLRVGLATAKGLAAPARVPVVPVPTLEALAESGRGLLDGGAGLACPMLDARRGEVYAALFRLGPDGARERLLPDAALPPEAVAERVGALAGGDAVLALGSGVAEYESALSASHLFTMPRNAPTEPAPAAMAAMVAAAAAGGLPGALEASALEPVYLRGV